MEGNNHLEVAAQAAQRLSILAQERGLALTAGQQKQFCTYAGLLLEWNARINLTRIVDAEGIAALHFLDSVMPLTIEGLIPEGARVIDVGSGAGFPGIALKIIRPDIQLTLNDALQKRLNFLDAVVKELGLSNVRLCHARAEDGGRDPRWREQFDLAVARGVAALPVLAELLLPFVKVGGKAVCYKGPAASEEWDAGQRAARLLGGGKLERMPIVLPGQEDWEHCVIALPKKEKTVRHYPRKAGTPGREPLGQTGGK